MKKTIATLFIILTVGTGAAFAQTGFSEINNELFDKAHLKNVNETGTLKYAYTKDSFIEGARADTIDMHVSNIRNTGRLDSSFNFFTGPHNRPYQPRDNQQGNSIFVLFLEYDISEMERLTTGDRAYFQRRLRWAFAEGADKRPVKVNYKGQEIDAVEYTVQPYLKDPENHRYKLYANKKYIFTMSEQIPGEFYQIRTVVPEAANWQDGDPVLVDETVTFVEFVPES